MEKYLKVIDNLLEPDECADLIKYFEAQPTEHVDRMIAEYERVEMEHPELAKMLWDRLKELRDLEIPDTMFGGKVVGLNEHFRFSKYHPGMEFQVHKDGVNQDRRGNRSVMTLNIFLNNDFDGGETDFYWTKDNLRYSIKPLTGRAGLFDGQQYHAGNMVTRGCKYLLRTDLMAN